MKERISALMDDEIDADGADHLFKALKSDAELAGRWSTYHMIGDVMRGEAPLSADFSRKLMAQIDNEPTVLAPRKSSHHAHSFLMTAVASVAAVMFVSWMVLQQQAHSPSGDIAPTVAINSVSPESVNSYVVAHQNTFAGAGIQAAYYVRPVALSENGN